MIIITEMLVPLSNEYYNILMKQAEDPILNKILNTPVKNLPGYSFLVLDNNSELQNRTVLEILVNTRFRYTDKHLSVTSDKRKVIGYFAYRLDNGIVTTLVMFSFLGVHQKDNRTLLTDVVNRIKELIPKVKEIHWTVAKNNLTAIKVYDNIITNISHGANKVDNSIEYEYIIPGELK